MNIWIRTGLFCIAMATVHKIVNSIRQTRQQMDNKTKLADDQLTQFCDCNQQRPLLTFKKYTHAYFSFFFYPSTSVNSQIQVS